MDPEEVFGAIFGGERFVSIIGQISLGQDMKAALQEAEDAQAEEEGGKKVVRDAKGREILSEEEKARKEEKDRKAAAEVCSQYVGGHVCFLTVVESGGACGADTEACGRTLSETIHIYGVCDGTR